MTSFFPDVNVWLALSWNQHSHCRAAWNWLDQRPHRDRLIFSRYTQLGLLRLLANSAVMGERNALALRQAWAVYDRWLQDPRVVFYPEPENLEMEFRQAITPWLGKPAHQWIGDGYLMAYARAADAVLVTFDQALAKAVLKNGSRAIIPDPV